MLRPIAMQRACRSRKSCGFSLPRNLPRRFPHRFAWEFPWDFNGGFPWRLSRQFPLQFPWHFLPVGALYPGRPRAAKRIIQSFGRLVLIARRCGARRYLRIAAARVAEWIGLTDQARELRQRVALAASRRLRIAAANLIGKRSILISFSHRDDASPTGKPPTRMIYEPAPAVCPKGPA